MTHHELHKTIVELRAELVHLTDDKERTRIHVQQLITTLERQLSSSVSKADTATLHENISNTITRLEAEHPRVTLLLNQMMNILSGSGI